MEGQIRALKFALLYDRGDILLVWMVEFAGALINRCEVGHDGRTPYGRLRKKSELGELVNFVGNRLAKLDSLWVDGVFFLSTKQ